MASGLKLNPCDCLFLAQHQVMARSGLVGATAFMALELEGHPDVHRLRQAVGTVLRRHPTIFGGVNIPRFGGPRWRPAARPDADPLPVFDHRHDTDWNATTVAVCEEQLAVSVDLETGPLVRLGLCLGPEGKSMLFAAGAHLAMDAYGTQLLFTEILSLCGDTDHQPPAKIEPDRHRLNPLRQVSLLRRLRLAAGFWRLHRAGSDDGRHWLADDPNAAGRWRLTLRHWSASDWRRLVRCASEQCPDGPARLSRYLAACVIRAADQMLQQRGQRASQLRMPMPMPLVDAPPTRPVRGNYLVWAVLCADRAQLDDKRALMESFGRQLDDFVTRRQDLMNWTMLRALSQLPHGIGSRLAVRFVRFVTGFSLFQNVEGAGADVLGCKVTRSWAGSTATAPPGFNPVFWRSGSQLTLSVCWLEGYLRRETVDRFVALIEAEMFAHARA